MATISPGYTFSTTEQVTAAKLASLAGGTVSGIVNADIAAGAAIAYSKLSLSSSVSGSDIASATITSANMAASSIASSLVQASAIVAGLIKEYACRVFNASALSIAQTATAALTFDSERWDTDAMHSVASNTSRLTAQRPGKYLVFGHVSWAAASAGYRDLRIRFNGATDIARILQQSGQGSAAILQSLLTHYSVSASGDYFEMVGYQNSGAALSIEASSNFSPEFGMVLLT